jgi:hypothetical protein
MVRQHQPPDRRLPTSDELSARLSKLKGPRGRIVTLSGIANRHDTMFTSATWPGHAYSIPEFPGEVIWLAFTVPTQVFTLHSPGPTNNTSSDLRADFSVGWGWELIANPFIFPEPRARFASDFGTYDFYSSVPPGGHGFDAAWIVPAQTTIITDSKEHDPSPLEQLLATKVNGEYRLWFRHKVTELTVNNEKSIFGTITPNPEPPHWWATIALPHRVDIEITDAIVQPGAPR